MENQNNLECPKCGGILEELNPVSLAQDSNSKMPKIYPRQFRCEKCGIINEFNFNKTT